MHFNINMLLQKLIIGVVMFNRVLSYQTFKSYRTFYKSSFALLKKKQTNYDIYIESPYSNKYSPKSINQEKYLNYLMDFNVQIVLGIGPAGSGKTLLACYSAIQLLKKKLIKQIIITRPLVSVDDENIGFLPGNLNNKMVPWTQPIMDIFLNFYTNNEINQMISKNIIEISPLAFMRGRTFENSFIIADEMQNSSPNQMLMINTRIGNNSKLVITGDLKQTDKKELNGLVDFTLKYKRYLNHIGVPLNTTDNIQIVELNKQDIIRSPIVNKIIDIYEMPIISTNSFNVVSNCIEHIETKYKIIENDAALIPKTHYK